MSKYNYPWIKRTLLLFFLSLICVTGNVYAEALENEKIDLRTDYPVVEMIRCEKDNYEPVYTYIKTNLDPQFNINCYEPISKNMIYDKEQYIFQGSLFLQYQIDGYLTNIEYEIQFSDGFVKKIYRQGKPDYRDKSITCYQEENSGRFIPMLDGLKAFNKNIVFYIKDGVVRTQHGEYQNLSFYLSHNSTIMVPVRHTARLLGFTDKAICWLELEQKVVIGKKNRYTPYISNFNIDTRKNIITGERNNQDFTFETVIENKNGELFIPLDDILKACGIYKDRIMIDRESDCVVVDFTPNFNTNKITICQINGNVYNTKNEIDAPYFLDIEDKQQILKFGEICTETSFRSSTRWDSGYQGDPDCYIDFNNGTIIYLYQGKGDCGTFLGCPFLPRGLGQYTDAVFFNHSQ